MRADRNVIYLAEVQLVARERQVVAQKRNEGLEVVPVRGDRIRGDVPLISQMVEEVANLAFHLALDCTRRGYASGDGPRALRFVVRNGERSRLGLRPDPVRFLTRLRN